jgi:hypothetical protein
VGESRIVGRLSNRRGRLRRLPKQPGTQIPSTNSGQAPRGLKPARDNESKALIGTTKQAEEKLKNSVLGMTQNASESPTVADIEFKCDIFSSISEIPTFPQPVKSCPDAKPLKDDFFSNL